MADGLDEDAAEYPEQPQKPKRDGRLPHGRVGQRIQPDAHDPNLPQVKGIEGRKDPATKRGCGLLGQKEAQP